MKLVRGNFEARPGLVTELYNDGGLKHKVKTRIDYQVNFNWGLGAPDIGLPVDNFSIRWRGWLVPPRAGKYTLVIHADDGARLFLDGKLRLDAWGSIGRHSVDVQLDDRPYPLRLEHHEGIGDAMMYFGWMQKGGFREEPVPADVLFHDLKQAKLLAD
jgi:PA14 domain